MTWVKLSDTFAEDPRLDEAGPLALALHVAALCYCSRQLTDGRISHATVRRLLVLDDPESLAGRLVNVGLWKPTETGYELVDYLVDQPSADRVRDTQQKARERQQRWRDAKRGASRNGDVDASRNASGDGAPPRPAPPRRKARAGRGDDRLSGAPRPDAGAPIPRGTTPWQLGIEPTVTIRPRKATA